MNGLARFYRGKRVLITGHTGFKGAWLASWLKLLGAQVIGLALPPEKGRYPNLFEAIDLAKETVSILGDIRDPEAALSVFREHEPEVVFHLAAQSLVRRSYDRPVETYATNVLGTVHVLEAARHTPSVRAIVNVTSDKCYENREWPWGYREIDPMGGHDPYSSSKGCAELVTAAFRHSFFQLDGAAGVATARAGNVIGGGDWAQDRLIPDIVRALADGAPVIIRNPKATRPWQHVLEPLRGYLALAERLVVEPAIFAGGWNFGPDDSENLPVWDLADRVLEYWGGGELVDEGAGGLHEAHYLKLDISKSRAELGWSPILSLDEELQMTIAWYKGYLEDPASARDLLSTQIAVYMERLRE